MDLIFVFNLQDYVMETNLKHWKMNGEGNFILYQDKEKIGTLTIHSNLFHRRAFLEIGTEKYNLKHSGFWKNHIEISDAEEKVILRTYAEKWYANTTTIAFDGKKLKLLIRNNPLAEYAIVDGDKELLSYGLETKDGKAVTKICKSILSKSYLLDFYLWYLFAPVARENMGDDLTFLLLSIA